MTVYLPQLVNQFRDAKGNPWPPVSVDGGPKRDYTHVMCGDASGAMAIDFATRGAKTPDPTVLRQRSSHESNRDGLTARELAATLTLMGSPAKVRIVPVIRFQRLMARPGAFVCLLVDDDTFNGCDPSYLGDHWIGLPTGVAKPGAALKWAAYDPTCPPKADNDGLPPGAEWEVAQNVIDAATKWSRRHGYGDRVTYVSVRQAPAPEPPPVDPRDAEIARLKAENERLEDEIDDLRTAVDVAGDALDKVRS